MLSERQKLVLIAIIEEYVKTNEPVGSFALSKRPELNFSTATLRNEMAQLEEMGFLEKGIGFMLKRLCEKAMKKMQIFQ